MDKHDTILLACGTAEDRRQIRGVLQEHYHLLEADSIRQMMMLLEQNVDCIAALVLMVTVPEKVETAFLEDSRVAALLEKVPTIVMGAADTPELVNRGFGMGAADVIPKDYEPYAMLHRIENIVDLHLHKQYLEKMVRTQARALRHSNEMMVDALSSIIEYRSVESGQHILRIRHFTKILLEEVVRSCPEYALDATDIAVIASASALHDIGKIAIPDAILMKSGPLTEEEMDIMRTHAITGCHILDTLADVADRDYLRYAHNICHYHHERWDGKGYPEGLAGEQIPICAQVVGLADVYDALTTKRVYKDSYSFAQAANMILRGDCGVFSPKLLECFKHISGEFEELARAYADGLSPRTESFDTSLPGPAKLEENSLERVQAKYTSLLHYIDGMLMEVDLDQDMFHLVYNPYPEMSWLNEVTTFSGIVRDFSRQVECVEEETLWKIIHEFIEAGLRRSTRYFELSGQSGEKRMEVTMLRLTAIDASRRNMGILCRRTEDAKAATQLPMLSDSSIVCRNDAGFTLLHLGSHVAQVAGYHPEELDGLFGSQLLELVLPEDREPLRNSLRRQFERGTQAEAEFRIRHRDGSYRWISERARLSLDDKGQEILHCYLTDITASRRAFDELNHKLSRYEIILAQTENVLFEWDKTTDRISFSDTWETLFGFAPTQRSVRETLAEGSFFHPDDLPLLLDRIAAVENGSGYETAEVRMATSWGRYLWCRFRATAVRDEAGNLTKIVGIIINIDAEKQAQRLLQDKAERDALTKLLNKTAGRKQAEEYLARFPQGNTLLIIDLDNFKEVNDRYGHLFGDAVLTKAAREIEKLFRSQDIVSRIGGDEFMVLMRGVSDRNLISNRCRRLLNIFANTFQNGPRKLPLSCSIGIAISGEHGTDYYELFNHADQALYRAKSIGKNDFCYFDWDLERSPAARQSRSAVSISIDSDEELGLAEDNLVRHAFRKLCSAQDPDQAVNELLAMVGQKMQVSRVYVFENSEDNRFCYNTYEWCNQGIEPQIHNLQAVSYEADIPGYADNFDEQGIFYVQDIRRLPRNLYEILEPQGIRSLLHCAVREGGVFRGYIGFDECVAERLWTKDEIRILQYFSEVLGAFLLSYRRQQNARIQAEELNTILDNQSGWLYIIDPKTYELKFMNQKTARRALAAAPGERCYRALMGREEPCPGCPVAAMEGENSAAILTDGQLGIRILAEATIIRWQGEESCLLSCRKLPE